MTWKRLEQMLEVHFQNPELLNLALTHRSYIYETPGAGQSSNERLEFLGDSILAFISADFLYRTFPDLTEGELTDGTLDVKVDPGHLREQVDIGCPNRASSQTHAGRHDVQCLEQDADVFQDQRVGVRPAHRSEP